MKTRRRVRISRPKTIRRVRKPAKQLKPKTARAGKSEAIGVVIHYFPKVRAAVIKLKKPLCVGEPVWIKGPVTDFRQTVASMQIDRKPIEKARAGDEIGLEVFSEVRRDDVVHRMKG